MEQSGVQEILKALQLYSKTMNQKLDDMKHDLENRMDERFEQVDHRFEQIDHRFEQIDHRFDRVEKKIDGLRVDMAETQETVDYLSSKNVQHERKLREIRER